MPVIVQPESSARVRLGEYTNLLTPGHPIQKALLSCDSSARDQWDAVDRFLVRAVVPALSPLFFFSLRHEPTCRALYRSEQVVQPPRPFPSQRLGQYLTHTGLLFSTPYSVRRLVLSSTTPTDFFTVFPAPNLDSLHAQGIVVSFRFCTALHRR